MYKIHIHQRASPPAEHWLVPLLFYFQRTVSVTQAVMRAGECTPAAGLLASPHLASSPPWCQTQGTAAHKTQPVHKAHVCFFLVTSMKIKCLNY